MSFSLGNTFNLAHPLFRVLMARFNSEIFWALFNCPSTIRTASAATRETFVVARAIHATTRADDTAARSTATTVGETLAIVAANHAAADAVCSANLPAYVFIGPTSTAPGANFVAVRSTLAASEPTQAATTLIYISTRSTLVRIRLGTSPTATGPKS